jgi:acyl carrier protein
MNETELRDTLLKILSELVPESYLGSLDWDERLRDQLDMDSMDFLNFLITVDEQLGVDIPERDYRKLRTLNDCVRYLQAQLTTPTS